MKKCTLLLLGLFATYIFAAPEDDLRKGNHQFSNKMYKALLDTKQNENFVFSPFPVQIILAALSSATRNDNSEIVTQIVNALNLPQTHQQTEQAFRNIIPELNKNDDDFKIIDVTKFYFGAQYTVKPWYKDIALSVYKTQIEIVNFARAAETIDKINTWVSKNTNNKISNFIETDAFAKWTTVCLINALYVTGKWDKPFDKSNNVKKYFHGLQSTSKVEMMVNHQSYEYREDQQAQYVKLELLRDGGGAQVIFMLPRQGQSLSELEKRFGDEVSKVYTTAKVDLILPKFTINTNLHLKPILESLGVDKLFELGLELQGLSNPSHRKTRTSDIFQKSFIEVTEWGVTAAAATEAVTLVDDPTDHKVFVADRPFAFQIIVDDIIIFAGHVADL